ncbi:hypothetical protein [Gracilibacillus saliphilus]|uniref:hypothetical protein n=1 Tax=Gracilibacillus saliphilus TaxID=543890 RepID=UPI0013CFD6CC|nr:hypothetical protein [Gracilibacillus saliphilus]
MTISLTEANSYLDNHLFNDKWVEADETKKQNALNTAESIINSQFNLKDGAEESSSYLHATCEQALHLLNYAKERYQLQQEGVTYYAVDGLTFQMGNALLSPIAHSFLKSITKRRIGNAI